MIKVKFLGALAPLLPKKDEEGFWVISQSEISVKDVVAMTAAKDTMLKYSVLVNNQRKTPDYLLKDGDTMLLMLLMPLMAGG